MYRLYGESAEAGGWMCLEADRDPAETSAFEEWYSTPLRRMWAPAWCAPESLARTEFAERQLAAARRATSDYAGQPADWVTFSLDLYDEPEEPEDERRSFTDHLVSVGVVLMMLGFFGVWAVGFITFVRWLWQ